MLTRFIILMLLLLSQVNAVTKPSVTMKEGRDTSAGGDLAYIITTPLAVYYLEKSGGGLSSMLDKTGVDWLGFHKAPGSGHKGEYRGFPNAVHRQDGNYFHAMNAGTDPSNSVISIQQGNHIQIIFTSDNNKWQAQWDFYPDRCDFTMSKVSPGYQYWVQYEGVPFGEMDSTDYRYSSFDQKKHPIESPFMGDLPSPEWMAFGDQLTPRVLYVLHHEDDELPDDYVSRPDMTVLGFGRHNKEKYLNTPQRFSIGFIESDDYATIENHIKKIIEPTKIESKLNKN